MVIVVLADDTAPDELFILLKVIVFVIVFISVNTKVLIVKDVLNPLSYMLIVFILWYVCYY